MSAAVTLQDAFRDVMASVCTPVSVVTTLADGFPHGTTVSAFASLSMTPPMVLVSLDGRSRLLGMIRETGRFGLNVLGSDQAELALTFARKGEARFADVAWEIQDEVPRLLGSGFVACGVNKLVDGGDHVVVMGGVLSAAPLAGAPLTYHARSFGTHSGLS
ncbi:flavin reductase family protein [Streptomyces sp. BH105]|uniref:flavin reductase family protein n=1 Tax=Streptomyces sp. BH105 TaxID=3410408 RepID=UPI003CE73F83